MTGKGSGLDPFVWGRRALFVAIVAVYAYVVALIGAIATALSSLEAQLFGAAFLVAGALLPVYAWRRFPLLRAMW